MRIFMMIALAVSAVIAGWTTQSESLDHFFAMPDFSQANRFVVQSDFEKALTKYSLGSSIVLYANDESRGRVRNAVTALSDGSPSPISKKDVESVVGKQGSLNFGTTLPTFGRQPFCIIQYNSDFTVIEDGQRHRLGDRTPETVPFVRAVSYHEVEHCLMPQWMIKAAVQRLTTNPVFANDQDRQKYLEYYRVSLSEIFADVFASAFMPETTEFSKTILHYREFRAAEGGDLGPYKYNARVLEALYGYLGNDRLINSEGNRRMLFDIAIKSLPLPTEEEIRQDLRL